MWLINSIFSDNELSKIQSLQKLISLKSELINTNYRILFINSNQRFFDSIEIEIFDRLIISRVFPTYQSI